jgi:hypothetical protein
MAAQQASPHNRGTAQKAEILPAFEIQDDKFAIEVFRRNVAASQRESVRQFHPEPFGIG